MGTHIIKITADINGQIPESNETNNEREEFLPAIEYPDLIVTNITYAPQVINNGDIVHEFLQTQFF